MASSSLPNCDELKVLLSDTRADDVRLECGSSVSILCSGDPVSVSDDAVAQDEDDKDVAQEFVAELNNIFCSELDNVSPSF